MPNSKPINNLAGSHTSLKWLWLYMKKKGDRGSKKGDIMIIIYTLRWFFFWKKCTNIQDNEADNKEYKLFYEI